MTSSSTSTSLVAPIRVSSSSPSLPALDEGETLIKLKEGLNVAGDGMSPLPSFADIDSPYKTLSIPINKKRGRSGVSGDDGEILINDQTSGQKSQGTFSRLFDSIICCRRRPTALEKDLTHIQMCTSARIPPHSV